MKNRIDKIIVADAGEIDKALADLAKKSLEFREEHLASLVKLGVNLWRLQVALNYLEYDSDSREMKRVNRHISASFEELSLAGIEVEDHTGQRVPEGGDYALRIIEFQHQSGIEHEKVIETIKPSIYFNGTLLQPGEVIVGIPERTSDVSNETVETSS